jgi:hypothetical protein
MTKPVSIQVDAKAQPNLRKLARALIALARKRLAEEQASSEVSSRSPGP